MEEIRQNFMSGFWDGLQGEPYDAHNNRFVGYAEGFDIGEQHRDDVLEHAAEGFAEYFGD